MMEADLSVRTNILHEADFLVSGDRQEAYKHPIHDYGATAAIWRAMILKRYGIDVPLSEEFCCLMMIGMKLSRASVENIKRDTLVDIAGYARCTEMVLKVKDGEPLPPQAEER